MPTDPDAYPSVSPAPPRRDRLERFERDCGALLSDASLGLATHTMLWAAAGFTLGMALLGEWFAYGLLPTGRWLPLPLVVATLGTGAIAFARVGWLRGLQGATDHVGVERAMIAYLVHRLLDAVANARGSDAQPLEAQTWRSSLVEAPDLLPSTLDSHVRTLTGDRIVAAFRDTMLTRTRLHLGAHCEDQANARGGWSVQQARLAAPSHVEERVAADAARRARAATLFAAALLACLGLLPLLLQQLISL